MGTERLTAGGGTNACGDVTGVGDATNGIDFAGGDVMTLKNNGNVGIGTTNPGEMLHISMIFAMIN